MCDSRTHAAALRLSITISLLFPYRLSLSRAPHSFLLMDSSLISTYDVQLHTHHACLLLLLLLPHVNQSSQRHLHLAIHRDHRFLPSPPSFFISLNDGELTHGPQLNRKRTLASHGTRNSRAHGNLKSSYDVAKSAIFQNAAASGVER